MEPFTNQQNTRGIIYILRDPRDVCISYSKHSGITIDKCIDFMITVCPQVIGWSLVQRKNFYRY